MLAKNWAANDKRPFFMSQPFVKSVTLNQEWAIYQKINEESLKGAESQSYSADRCQQVMKVISRQKLK
jgi:hypothetical protein